MPRARLHDLELHYEDTGPAPEADDRHAMPLLLHHAHAASHASWAEVVTRLRAHHRCITFDARGTGASERPAQGYAIEQLAEDVVALADALDLPRFVYVGHSLGGLVGYALGLRHASRLHQLVLVAPAPADGMQLPEPMRARLLQPWRDRDREAMIRERTTMLARPLAPEEIAIGVDTTLAASPEHFEQTLDAVGRARLGAQLHAIQTPTLMIAGAADGLLASNLRDYERLGHATLHVFSRVSHAIHREVPEPFVEVLRDFLAHGVVTASTLHAARMAAAAPPD